MRSRILPFLLASSLLVGCGVLPPPPREATPAPSPITPAPTPSPPPATPTPEPTPTPSPTPDLSAIPGLEPGTLAATTTGGLRVRGLPGVQRRIEVQSLPAGHRLLVLMGPIVADDLGWYLVADADDGEPDFSEGWIAAGFEPDAYLAPIGGQSDNQPVVAGFAHTGDAAFGPIAVPDEQHAIRWMIVAPDGGCRFEILLGPQPDEGVTVALGTVSTTPVSGIRHQTFFADHGGLRGDLFLTVKSDCAWAVTILRTPVGDDEGDE